MIWLLVLIAQHGSPGIAVSPYPYATEEACKAAAKHFEQQEGPVWRYGYCIPAEKGGLNAASN